MIACRSVAVGLIALLLAACGGGASMPPRTSAAGSATRHAAVSFTVRIPKPKRSPSRRERRPRFVDPTTVAIFISSGSTLVATLRLDPTTCAPPDANGDRICLLSGSLPVGSATYVFQASDTATVVASTGLPAPIAVLSSALVPIDVVAGAANVVHVSLGGVLTSLAVSLGNNSALPSGTPMTVPLAVSGKDSAQATIIGPEPYSDENGALTPVTVTTSDPVNAGLLLNGSGSPAASVTVTSPSDAVSLAYTGASNVVATIEARFTPTAATVNARTPSSVTAFIGGGGFRPVLTALPGDPLLSPLDRYGSIARTPDGSGLVVSEDHGSLVSLDLQGNVTGRLDLTSRGIGGEPISIDAIAVLGGKLIAVGVNGAGTIPQQLRIYALDVTSLAAPVISAPINENIDAFNAGSVKAAALAADGRLWIAPGPRQSATAGGTQSLLAVAANLAMTLVPIPETALSPNSQVGAICSGPFGKSVVPLFTGVASASGTQIDGALIGNDGTDLGTFSGPPGSGITACVTAFDNSLWLLTRGTNNANILEFLQAPGHSDGSIGPPAGISDLRGFVPVSGYVPVGSGAAGTTSSNQNDIYFADLSSGSNLVELDTVAHIVTAVPAPSTPTLIVPDGNGNFYSIDNFSSDATITHLTVHP